MAKIIPLGAYQRIQDIHIPRTSREAWGTDSDIEKTAPIRPLWKDWAAGFGLVALIAVIVFVAGLAQSIYESDHAAHETTTRICAFNGGNCQ